MIGQWLPVTDWFKLNCCKNCRNCRLSFSNSIGFRNLLQQILWPDCINRSVINIFRLSVLVFKKLLQMLLHQKFILEEKNDSRWYCFTIVFKHVTQKIYTTNMIVTDIFRLSNLTIEKTSAVDLLQQILWFIFINNTYQFTDGFEHMLFFVKFMWTDTIKIKMSRPVFEQFLTVTYSNPTKKSLMRKAENIKLINQTKKMN